MSIDPLTSAMPELAPAAARGAAAAMKSERAVTADNPPQRETAPQAKGAEVHAAARQIESYLKSVGRTLEFRVDAETNRTVVTVRDAESGEVIRQIPGDEALRLARHLNQDLGALVDLKV